MGIKEFIRIVLCTVSPLSLLPLLLLSNSPFNFPLSTLRSAPNSLVLRLFLQKKSKKIFTFFRKLNKLLITRIFAKLRIF